MSENLAAAGPADPLAGAMGAGLDPVVEVAGGALAPARGSARLGLPSLAWALYEGARDPYVILVTIYIFNPYFATAVVGDGVKGQALVADIAMIYGLIVAATGPLLGASIDGIGRRKPLLALTTLLMIPLLFALWFVEPHGAGVGVGIGACILGLLGIVFAYSDIVHNSMLVRAASPEQAPFASGLALSLGNFVSVFLLGFVLWAFALPGQVPWSFIPRHPLFGLSQAMREPDRVVGPLVGSVMAVLALPIFFLTPDAPASGVPVGRVFATGWRNLKETVLSLRGHRDAALFLGSRMLYTDGMTALLVFTGVFAAGVMGWRTLELLAYGILLSVFAVIGGQVGALLDARFGPKRAVQIEVGVAAMGLLGVLGMSPDHILYVPFDPAAHAPLWNGPIFRTLPQVVFLAIGCGNAVFVTAQYASSRTFLTRLAPEGRTASFFGLYALSGTVTMWLGSALVRIATGVFKTQQAGFAPIAGLLILGLLGMSFVRHDGRPRTR